MGIAALKNVVNTTLSIAAANMRPDDLTYKAVRISKFQSDL